MTYQLSVGRCEEVLRGMADNSVDSIVTDPPYGLSFMGHKWDYQVPTVEQWAECLRVLKPDDSLAAFACSSCHDEIDRRTHIFDNRTARLYHAEGVFRTQSILRKEGILK